MSLLSHNELLLLIDDGVITHAKPEHVNSASIDIQLGNNILIERTDPHLYQQGDLKRVTLRNKDHLHMIEWDLVREGPYILFPGEFILAHSVEIFNLPNIDADPADRADVGLDSQIDALVSTASTPVTTFTTPSTESLAINPPAESGEQDLQYPDRLSVLPPPQFASQPKLIKNSTCSSEQKP